MYWSVYSLRIRQTSVYLSDVSIMVSLLPVVTALVSGQCVSKCMVSGYNYMGNHI